MANKDWPFGLQPVYAMGGGSPVVEYYPLAQEVSSVAYSTEIYKGQGVQWQNTLGCARANALTNATYLLGISAEYYAGSATTKTKIAVWPADKNIFKIQSDGTTTTSKLENVQMQNFALVNPTSGNTNSGISTSELDFSSVTTADNLLRVIGLTGEIGESEGANMKLLVRVNFGHAYQYNKTTP